MEGVRWKWEVEAQERSKSGMMQSPLVHGSKDIEVHGCEVQAAEEDVGYARRRYCFTEN